MLDTSIVIGVETARIPTERLPDEGILSVIAVEELRLGVLMADGAARDARQQTLDLAVAAYELWPVTRDIALASAEIRAEGRRRGRRYDPADAFIGATGRVLGLPVFTQDRGFEGMSGVDVRLV